MSVVLETHTLRTCYRHKHQPCHVSHDAKFKV